MPYSKHSISISIFLCGLCLLSLWHNVGFEFEVSIYTVPYCVILCHTVPCLDCHIVPCRPELNLCLRRKSHFQENGHHYFLRLSSNLLNKTNRFSTAGEVRGISMKIGIGEIYKKNKNNYLTSSKKLCIWIVVKFWNYVSSVLIRNSFFFICYQVQRKKLLQGTLHGSCILWHAWLPHMISYSFTFVF